jgi:hypothetical protein
MLYIIAVVLLAEDVLLIEISSINRTHLSRHHLKTEEEPSSETL